MNVIKVLLAVLGVLLLLFALVPMWVNQQWDSFFGWVVAATGCMLLLLSLFLDWRVGR